MGCILWLLIGVALFAEEPSFEVASIRKSQPITPELIASGLRIGIKIENGRVDIRSVTITGLLMYAFEVKDFQIAGPEWMEQRFDVVAKMPEGSRPEQVPAMLKRLLEERFHMQVRQELRNQRAYTLTKAKSGIRFRQATSAEIKAQTSEVAGVRPTTIKPTIDGDLIQGGSPGTLRRTFGPNGIRLEWDRITLAEFAETLSTMLGSPVLDKTGLSGEYQLSFEMTTPEAIQAARNRPLGEETRGTASQDKGDISGSDPFGNIRQAVQQMGLRLEKTLAPIDYIIVGHLDKIPAEN